MNRKPVFSICSSSLPLPLLIVLYFMVSFSNNVHGFGLSGESIPCNGTVIPGDQKLAEEFKVCNQSVIEDLTKRNITKDGYGPTVCTVLCVFQKEGLINLETGKLNQDSLEKFNSKWEVFPKPVRQAVKDSVKHCFVQHANDEIIDLKNKDNCWGVTGIGLCMKTAIEQICGETNDEDENHDTATCHPDDENCKLHKHKYKNTKIA